MIKVAIATLVKTDPSMSYTNLIARNKSLASTANKYSNINFLFFHEDDLTLNHRNYIKQSSPITCKFIPVQSEFQPIGGLTSSYCHETDLSKEFSEGYRNMCKFWFTGFFKYTFQYDKVIRFDEDCELVDEIPSDYFDTMGMPYVTASVYPEWDGVMVGAKAFYDDFCDSNGIEEKNWEHAQNTPNTNFVCMRPRYFHNDQMFKKFEKAALQTNCIQINRWGDSILWSMALHMTGLFTTLYYAPANPPGLRHLPPSGIVDKRIRYIHKSHIGCSDNNGRINC
jgi:hypothetical protein